MTQWKNLDTLASFGELAKVQKVNLVEAMSGQNGADRVKKYSVPMAEGLTYNYAAKQVDDQVIVSLENWQQRQNFLTNLQNYTMVP